MSEPLTSNLQSIRERDAGYIHEPDFPFTGGRYVSDNDDPVNDRHWLLAEVERLQSLIGQGCSVHGPCPICEAQKWLGDPRVGVSGGPAVETEASHD